MHIRRFHKNCCNIECINCVNPTINTVDVVQNKQNLIYKKNEIKKSISTQFFDNPKPPLIKWDKRVAL